ncbi:MAG: hypothetical protein HQK75_20805 [Candidatus Magnetomorum sp.]|nr:hypothetical protein [Candidatus Magnetomorum sp.]
MNIQRDLVKQIIMRELPSIIQQNEEIRIYIRQIIREETNDRFDILLNTIKELMDDSNQRWEENNQRWEENNQRWEENNKRWDKNDDKWDKNEKRLIAIENKLAVLDGRTLEIMYREKISSYFGMMLLRTKILQVNSIVKNLREFLSTPELKELFNLDLLVKGKIWDSDNTILVALEISSVVDKNDVIRAVKRSSLLRKAGFPAIACVAGTSSTEGGTIHAKKTNTVMLCNGSALHWSDAIDELDECGPQLFPSIKT